jgi:Uncharacterized phage-associated protein
MMTFCEECREMVAYSIKDITMQKKVKGKEIEFIGKEAYCPCCGSGLFVSSLRDYNLKQMDNAYREIEKLIFVDQIQQILQKYNIGKRPLSELLGWGEITLSRYLEGAIPTKQYSEILLEILNDVDVMESILERNKETIADIAYKKCKEAIVKMKSTDTAATAESKIDSVVFYYFAHLSDITPLALQKLLYYAQAFHKVFNGVFLFQNDCEAWAHGPVYSEIYHRYKNFGYDPIDTAIICNNGGMGISNNEKEILDSIINNFGCYSGKVLERMTHSELPWLTTRNGLSDDASSNEIISKDLIADYFEQIKRKYNILNTSDIRDYSEDLFKKLFK